MTGLTFRDDFERLVVDWLDETAGTAAPDYLDETFERIEDIPQRPAWLSPWRWLPMRATTLRRFEVPRFVPYLIALALLIAIGVAILAAAGSQRRLPPPFGPAATGSFAYDSAGDLYLAGTDGAVRQLTDTPDVREFGAVYSGDGTVIAYGAVPAGSRDASLWVMSADGTGAQRVSADLELDGSTALPLASWAPDGRRLVFWTRQRLYVVDRDGANLRELGDGSLLMADPRWSPRGDLIAVNGKEGPAGDDAIYAIAVEGGAVMRVSQTRAGFLPPWPEWSPDGRRIAYHAGATNADIFIATLDGASWTERAIVAAVSIDSWPAWSNDGTRISFVRSHDTDHGRIVVSNADGSGESVLESETIAWSPHCWTPDDQSIVAPTAEENVSIGDEDDPGFVILSVDGTRAPLFIPTPERQAFAACSWERLAP